MQVSRHRIFGVRFRFRAELNYDLGCSGNLVWVCDMSHSGLMTLAIVLEIT